MSEPRESLMLAALAMSGMGGAGMALPSARKPDEPQGPTEYDLDFWRAPKQA